jgi:transcription antitermination factor NusA-like protein
MDREAALRAIRECFSHVEVERIFVEYDPLVEEEIAKVVVRDDQLSEAVRRNGEPARLAAKQSGLAIEVVLRSDFRPAGESS